MARKATTAGFRWAGSWRPDHPDRRRARAGKRRPEPCLNRVRPRSLHGAGRPRSPRPRRRCRLVDGRRLGRRSSACFRGNQTAPGIHDARGERGSRRTLAGDAAVIPHDRRSQNSPTLSTDHRQRLLMVRRAYVVARLNAARERNDCAACGYLRVRRPCRRGASFTFNLRDLRLSRRRRSRGL